MIDIKVSIIVPVYNTEKYLERCLRSLTTQTLQNIEIICINDGSTDNSLVILKKYADRDKRIKIITQINLGVSEARNTGVENAKGEFIGFVDSDDFVDKDFYEDLYNAATENNCDIACGNIVRYNDKKRKRIFINYNNVKIAQSTKDKFELAGIPSHCYIWNKIYKRDSLIKSNVKFERGVVYEDMKYTPEVIEQLGDMVTVPDVFYHYWINETSIVKTPSDKNRADKIQINKNLIEKCRKLNIKLNERDQLICKKEYFLCGLRILKVYVYRATKIYSLFGVFPLYKEKEYI